jgi:tetratricopeptide (TPR) repeat protein
MRPSVILAGIALLALVVRLVYLAELDGSPLLSVLMGDSRQYDLWAQQLAGGQWIGTEIFYQTPLYPYALGVIFKVAWHSLGVVRVLQAVLGPASCGLLGLAGLRFFNLRVGVIAALLLAFYPPAIFFDGLIQKSSLDIFLISLVLVCLAGFQDRRRVMSLTALGLTTAALVLNRENAWVLYPVTGAWLLFQFRDVPVRRRLQWVAAFVAASLLVLLPVGIRNYRVGGELVLSTSQLGPNFFIGNHAYASGSYEPLVPGRGDAIYERADATALASKAVGRSLSPGEVSDYWLRRSWDDIRAQPMAWLALTGKKLLLTVNAAEIPDTESIEAYAESSRLLDALLWLNFGVVLPLAALGAWFHRHQWRRLLVLYGMVGGLALAVAAFYVVARYRHPMVPVVLLFSAAGLGALFDRRRTRHDWLPALGIAGALAAVAHVPMNVVHDQTYINLGAFFVRTGRATEAVPVLLKAVAVDPGDAAPHLQLGLAYRDTGRQPAALEELTTAVRLRPDSADARTSLGIMLRDLGRPAEALDHLREAARLQPQSADAHTNLGLALMEAGLMAEAVTEHRRAIALAPDAPSPHNNLALALHQSGDPKQAVAEYRQALLVKPDDAEAHSNLGLALAALGNHDEAFRHFAEAIRLQPDSYGVRLNFGKTLCEAGRIAEGIAQYAEAARVSPDSVEPAFLSAQVYARTGRLAEAEASLQKALGIATAAGRPDLVEQLNAAIAQVRARMRPRGR